MPRQIAGTTRVSRARYAKGSFMVPPKQNLMKKVARREANIVVKQNMEHKNYDLSVLDTAVDWAGSGAVFSIIPTVQGAGNQQIVGISIKPTNLKIRLNITSVPSGSEVNLIRLLVLQVKTGGVPTIPTTLASVSNVRAPLSDFDVSFRKTYRVLFDRLYSVDSNNKPQTQAFINIKSLAKMNFQTSTLNVQTGGLYLMAVSDSGAVSHPLIRGFCRLTYTD